MLTLWPLDLDSNEFVDLHLPHHKCVVRVF